LDRTNRHIPRRVPYPMTEEKTCQLVNFALTEISVTHSIRG
jgi:hypothetical protein